MSDANLVLNAYYEAVYDLLDGAKDGLQARVEVLLREEVEVRGYEGFDEEKFSAYRDACFAFIVERIETFNPVGYQYTFDRSSAKEAFELELQLDWYDAKGEFQILAQSAREKAKLGVNDENLRGLAEELIGELGVFPDRSIIETYRAGPGLQKLPDYLVALAIEEVAR